MWEQVAAVAGVLAPAILVALHLIKRFVVMPGSVVLGVAIALGVGAALLLEWDVSALPFVTDAWRVRILVGIAAGGIASLQHEAAAALRSVEKRNLAGTGESAL